MSHIGFVGCAVGFTVWFVLLECKGLGNVWYRSCGDGTKKFTLGGVKKYMLYPFQDELFWKKEYLRHNWLLMTALGGFIAYGLSKFPFE